MIERICSCAAAVAALSITGLTAPTALGAITPLVFGPLDDPGDGSYFTQVYDISADGRSYVGLTNNNVPRYVANGTVYNQTGMGAALAIAGNGMIAGGGTNTSGTPQRWQLADAAGSNIAGAGFPLPAGPSVPDGRLFPGGQIYGLNRTGTIANVIGPTSGTWVVTPDTIYDIRTAFADIEVGASYGANRGMATNAPILVGLVNIPSQGFGPARYNYETGEAELLTVPAGATSAATDSTGWQISADGNTVGGSFTFPAESPLAQPGFWDADGNVHRVPGIDGRIWGDVKAVDASGNFMGGGLFGPGLQREAYFYNRLTNESVNLNDVFADLLPDGWLLIETQHISNDGSRLFVRAQAPDGSFRIVGLDGDAVPTPGTATLLALAGAASLRRRRG